VQLPILQSGHICNCRPQQAGSERVGQAPSRYCGTLCPTSCCFCRVSADAIFLHDQFCNTIFSQLLLGSHLQVWTYRQDHKGHDDFDEIVQQIVPCCLFLTSLAGPDPRKYPVCSSTGHICNVFGSNGNAMQGLQLENWSVIVLWKIGSAGDVLTCKQKCLSVSICIYIYVHIP